MKKVSYVIQLLLVLLMVTSCSKDDDSKDQESIIGKWYHNTIMADGFTEKHEHTAGCDKDYLDFITESKINGVNHSDSDCTIDQEIIAYALSGNKITIFDEDTSIKGTYSIKGDDLTLILTFEEEGEEKEEVTFTFTRN